MENIIQMIRDGQESDFSRKISRQIESAIDLFAQTEKAPTLEKFIIFLAVGAAKKKFPASKIRLAISAYNNYSAEVLH